MIKSNKSQGHKLHILKVNQFFNNSGGAYFAAPPPSCNVGLSIYLVESQRQILGETAFKCVVRPLQEGWDLPPLNSIFNSYQMFYSSYIFCHSSVLVIFDFEIGTTITFYTTKIIILYSKTYIITTYDNLYIF